MTRTVYVNGEFVPEDRATISIFDRGFLFADAVYEVSSVLEGHLVDNAAHLARLARSLKELDMKPPASDAEIQRIQQELIARNGLNEGIVYLQVSRGAADRDFAIPRDIPSSLVMFTQTMSILQSPRAEAGVAVITVPDIRWRRRDIKTVGLLAPSLAKQQALDAGAGDAWMVEDGYVTEGSSNNAYIVLDGGKIVTRQLSQDILHGITRRAVLELARRDGLEVEERPFTPEEAYGAKEAFTTSASGFVMPVVRIDDHQIGDGTPGALTKRLRQLYIEMALHEARAAA